MMKISERLRQIAQYISDGRRVADIGSDHALLPVYLLQSGKSPSAIAGEVNPGPLQAARKAAADAGLADRLDVRAGDGLAVLQPGEADTIVIAGMGGALMRDILESGRAAGKLEGVTELALQPNVGEELVRGWLLRNGWYLAAETILEEDGKIYEVLHAVVDADAEERNRMLYDDGFLGLAAAAEAPGAVLLRMGPHLTREAGAVWRAKWKRELEKLERICDSLSESELPEAASKRTKLREEIARIEEVLHCLQTDKPSFN